jgi:hypothetical protein
MGARTARVIGGLATISLFVAACGTAPGVPGTAGPADGPLAPAVVEPYPVEPYPVEPYPAPTPTTEPVSVVGLLIVDDFQPPQSILTGYDLVQPTPEGNCIVNPSGQGVYGIRGGSGTPGDQPHGSYVSSQAQVTLERGLGYTKLLETAGPIPSIRLIQTWELGGEQIVLAEVDTVGYTTTEIAPRIEAAMEALRGPYGATRFVLNMSFAIVPCDPSFGKRDVEVDELLNFYKQFFNSLPPSDPLNQLWADLERIIHGLPANPELLDPALYAEFAQKRMALLYEPVRSRLEEGQIQGSSAVKGATFDPDRIDPLYEKLLEHREELIAVAAAGNYGLPFPYAPALWDDVLAVSAPPVQLPASNCSPTPIAFIANAGEVLVDGQHFEVNSNCQVGTSFAAPTVSVYAASYFLADQPVACPNPSGGNPTQPPLEYAAELQPQWSSTPLRDAATIYCPAFPAP